MFGEFFQGFLADNLGDVTFQLFNDGEELEDDSENDDEADENEGIQVFTEAKHCGKILGSSGKEGKEEDVSPDDAGHEKLEKRLTLHSFHEFKQAAHQKKYRDEGEGYLEEREGGHRL